jgi:outer membrane protein assembly factor BamE (lipoprotein component of BamABCDE complex)
MRRAPVASQEAIDLHRPRALLLCCLMAPVLAGGGCSVFESPAQVRGNRVDADQMKQLVPGTSTRSDVTALLGSPTTHASFDDNTWIYIGEVTRPRVAQVQGVESQDVVVVTFDDKGVLEKVAHLTQKDAEPVTVVARTTPSPGTNATFLQQLFGNVGRFSPTIPGAGSNNVGNLGGVGATGSGF